MNLDFLCQLNPESVHSQMYFSLMSCCIPSVFAVINYVFAALAGRADKNINKTIKTTQIRLCLILLF